MGQAGHGGTPGGTPRGHHGDTGPGGTAASRSPPPQGRARGGCRALGGAVPRCRGWPAGPRCPGRAQLCPSPRQLGPRAARRGEHPGAELSGPHPTQSTPHTPAAGPLQPPASFSPPAGSPFLPTLPGPALPAPAAALDVIRLDRVMSARIIFNALPYS